MSPRKNTKSIYMAFGVLTIIGHLTIIQSISYYLTSQLYVKMTEVNEANVLQRSLFKNKTQFYKDPAAETYFKQSTDTFKPLGANFANQIILKGAPLLRIGTDTPNSPQWPSRNHSQLNSVQNTSGEKTPNLNLIAGGANMVNLTNLNAPPQTKGIAERMGLGEDSAGQTLADEGELMVSIWENVLLLSILYNSFTFAYFLGIPGFPGGVWMLFEIVIEIIMLVDLIIRYIFRRTMVISEDSRYDLLHGSQDSGRFGIAMYLLSSIPSTIILYSSIPLDNHDDIWIAFIRGLKLYRIKQINIYFDIRDIRSKKDNFIRTFQASLYIILVTHLLACFWLFIGRVDPEQEKNWMQLLGYNKNEVQPVQMYTDALFFAVISMTGLGLTPMYPRTNLEYAMHSFIMLLGVSLYVNFFAFFAVTIYKKNRLKIENMLKYEESRQMANLKGFSWGIRFMIREYYNNLRLDFVQLNLVYKANFELPMSIREQISSEINTAVLERSNIFQFIDKELSLKISRYLHPEMCQSGDFIMRRGEVANRLYFIKSGKVQICATDEKTVIAQQYQGSFFGEIGIFIQGKRTCSVRAKVDSIFLCIIKNDLLSCLNDSPTILKYLVAVGRQRMKTTRIEDITAITSNEPIHGGWLADIVQYQPEGNKPNLRESINLKISHKHIEHKFIKSAFRLYKWHLIDEFKDLKYFAVIPYSVLYNLQSFLIMVAIFFDIVYVPFSIALDYDLDPTYRNFDYIQYILYFGDTCLRPYLAVDENMNIFVPPTDSTPLLRRYLLGRFLFDALATVPFDYIALIVQDHHSLWYKHLRLFRFFKLYRVIEILEVAKKRSSMNVLLVRIGLFIAAFITIIYWFNCMLIYVSRQETFHGNSESRFDGQTMLSFVEGSVTSGNKPLAEWSAWEMYANFMITATSFSITFGDVMPFTMAEEVVAIIQIIIGRLLMAFFFAEVSSFVGLKFTAYDDHLDQYSIVRTWLALNGLSAPLRKRVDRYFATKWQIQRGVREEQLIAELPSPMIANVHRFIFGNLTRESILLKDTGQPGHEGMIKSVLERLERIMVPREEFIIKQGELADEMFFIIKGEVQIISADKIIIATLTENMHFGEMALIEDENIKVRSTSAMAKSNVTLAVLSVKNFKLIFSQYPQFKEKLQEIVKMRANGLQQINNIGSMQGQILNRDSDLYSSKSQDEIDEIVSRPAGRKSSIMERSPQLDRKSIIKAAPKGKKKMRASKTMPALDFGLKPDNLTLKRIEKLQKYSSEDSDDDNDDGSVKSGASEQIGREELDGHDLRVGFQKSSTDSMKSSYLESDETPRVKTASKDRVTVKRAPPDNIDIRIERLEEEDLAVRMETLVVPTKDNNLNTVFTENGETNQLRLLDSKNNNNGANSGSEIKVNTVELLHPSPANQNPQGNQIDQYLLQARMKDLGPNTSIVTIFFFYAFKYFLVLPLSIYNIVFIPLQMGFSLEFQGWYLFLECLTIIAYSVDLIFLARMFLILRKRLCSIQACQNSTTFLHEEQKSLPSGGSFSKYPDWSDNEKVERRFKQIRIDLILSALSICPFSLIFQDSNHSLFIINVCRMMRMLKLLPVYRFLKVGKKLFNVRLFRLTEIMIAYYLLSHLISGIILSIGLADKNFTDYYGLYKEQMEAANTTSIIKVMEKQTLYIQGLYLGAGALTHGTVGDLDRIYEGDRAWGLLQIWGLIFCYMLLFASISSIFRGGDSYLHFNYRYQHVRQHVQMEMLNDKTKNKINLYFDLIWNKSHGFNEQTEVLSLIPLHLRIDAMKERYQEALENSIVFSNPLNGIEEAVVDSFLNLIQIEIFMPREFMLKVGVVNDDFLFILDGEALIVGLDNKIIGILRPGAHLHQDIGTGLKSQDIHEGKSIYYLISKTQITLGVLKEGNLKKLFAAFPKWKHQVRKLNNQTQQRAKENLEEFLAPVVRLDPYCDEYRVEMATIEKFLAESSIEAQTEIIRTVLDTKENEFIYDQDSNKYRRHDIIRQHTKLLHSASRGFRKPSDKKSIGFHQGRSDKMTSLKLMHVATLSGKKLKSAAAVKSLSIIDDGEDQSQLIGNTWGNLQKYTYFSKYSRARTNCDIIHFLNLVYIAFFVPFFITFSSGIDKDVLFIFETASLIAQAVVIFVNLRTPVLIGGMHTLELQLVLKFYWQNGGLLYDLFGLLPINLAYGITSVSENAFAYVGIVRFTRMIALFKMEQLFEKLQILMKNHSILIVVLKSILFLLVLWHWTSCIWYFINFATYSHFQVSWLKKFAILSLTLPQQYLLCLYYVIKAVTGVGFPDMAAYNNIEKVMFILIINLGDALFAIAFGMIEDMQMHVFESSGFQRQLEKAKEVEQFLCQIKADNRSRTKVQNFHRYFQEAKSQKLVLEAKDLVGYLPESIVQEVLFSHYRDILRPLSESIRSDNFMIALCRSLTLRIYLPSDLIVKKDEEGKEMFFIIDGEVDVLSSDNQTIIRTLYPGNSFGEVALILGIKRIAHVKAKTFVLLSVLQQIDMRRILQNFPSLKSVFNGIAQKRLREALKAEAKQAIRLKFKTLQSKWNLDKSLENALRIGDDGHKDENSTNPFFSTPTTHRDQEESLIHLKTEQPVQLKSLFKRKIIQDPSIQSTNMDLKHNILGVNYSSNNSAQFGPQLHLAFENIANENVHGPSFQQAPPTLSLHIPDDPSRLLRPQKSQPISRDSGVLHNSSQNNAEGGALRKLASINNSNMFVSQHSQISGNHPINARLSFQHTFKPKVAPLLLENSEKAKGQSNRSSILVSPGGENIDFDFLVQKDQEIIKEDVEKWPSFTEQPLSSESEKNNWDEKVLPEIMEENNSDNQEKDFLIEALDDQIKFISSPPLSMHNSQSPRNREGEGVPRDVQPVRISQAELHQARSTFSTERRRRSLERPVILQLDDQTPSITIARPLQSRAGMKRASTRVKGSTEKKVKHQLLEERASPREEKKQAPIITDSERRVIQLLTQAIKNEELLEERELEQREKLSVRIMKAKTDRRKGGEKRLSQIRLARNYGTGYARNH